MSALVGIGTPTPSPAGGCVPPPLVKGGGRDIHSLARDGVGEPDFGRLEKKASTLSILCQGACMWCNWLFCYILRGKEQNEICVIYGTKIYLFIGRFVGSISIVIAKLKVCECQKELTHTNNWFYSLKMAYFCSTYYTDLLPHGAIISETHITKIFLKLQWTNPPQVFIYFSVLSSTQLHLPPLRFHCVGGCWYRAQDICDIGIGCYCLSDDVTIRLNLIHVTASLIQTRPNILRSTVQ